MWDGEAGVQIRLEMYKKRYEDWREMMRWVGGDERIVFRCRRNRRRGVEAIERKEACFASKLSLAIVRTDDDVIRYLLGLLSYLSGNTWVRCDICVP